MSTFLLVRILPAAALLLATTSMHAQLPPPPGTGLLPPPPGPGMLAPVCDTGPDISVVATGEFTLVDLSVTASDPDGDDANLVYLWSLPEGSAASFATPETAAVVTGSFPVGDTLVSVAVTDEAGISTICELLISVTLPLPPAISCEVDPERMWPPNHRMRRVVVTARASSGAVASLSELIASCHVTSDEPDSEGSPGPGKGRNHSGDVNGEDGFSGDPVPVNFAYDAASDVFEASFWLRSERLGSGDGRSYEITCTVEDPFGQKGEATCVVFVPHDRRDGLPSAAAEARERKEARKARKLKKSKRQKLKQKKRLERQRLARSRR